MNGYERIAVALERIAERIKDPGQELVERVAHLEQLLREFIAIMKNPHSTDEDWAELLADVQEALGVAESVDVA